MNEKEVLEEITKWLKGEGFDSAMTEPHPQVLLYMGQDEKGRERIVEIAARQQELGDPLKETSSSDAYFQIRFMVKLPFECKDECLYDLGSALLWLNRTLDLPGFELSELEARPLYRYVLLCKAPLDKKLILALCGFIGLTVSLYSEMLENISTGKKTFNKTMQEILELVK